MCLNGKKYDNLMTFLQRVYIEILSIKESLFDMLICKSNSFGLSIANANAIALSGVYILIQETPISKKVRKN